MHNGGELGQSPMPAGVKFPDSLDYHALMTEKVQSENNNLSFL